MCKAMEEMRDETKDRTIVENIKSPMSTLKLSAQQAVDALQIPADQQDKYLAKL